MKAAFRSFGLLTFLTAGLLIRTPAAAQQLAHEKLASGISCDGIDLERAGYVVGAVTLRGPIEAPWLFNGAGSARKRLQDELGGSQFTYSGTVVDELRKLQGKGRIPIGAAGAFRVSMSFVVAVRCDTAARVVDLQFNVYTIPPATLMSGTPEWQDQSQKAPADAVGLTAAKERPFHATPEASFTGWKQLVAGGHSSWEGKAFSILADGSGSASQYRASLAASGTHNTLGPVAQWNWMLNGNVSSQPTAAGVVARNQLALQATANTRTFANGNLMARFGGQIEGGSLRSTLTPAQSAANSIPGGRYVSERFYGGLTSRATHNVFSASAGVESGIVTGADGHWVKGVVDVTDDFWVSAPSHHPFELETRLTAGDLLSARNIPEAARFYGGGAIVPFLPGDAWQINSGPLIRAIPAGRLGLTSAGPGASDFVSTNVTASWPFFVKPLVPEIVGKEIEPLIEGQLITAHSVLQNSYAKDEKGAEQMIDLTKTLGPALDRLTAAVTAAQTANAGQPGAPYDACLDPLPLFSIIVASVATEDDKYSIAKSMPGQISDLFTMDCAPLLAQSPVDLGVRQAAEDIQKIGRQIAETDASLQAAADKKATDATKFSRRALRTVMNDFNIVSVAPVAIADWARIGPSGNGFKGSRFGPGVGIRLELATYVNFTVGCAFDIHPQRGEGARAFFFSIGVRDILH